MVDHAPYRRVAIDTHQVLGHRRQTKGVERAQIHAMLNLQRICSARHGKIFVDKPLKNLIATNMPSFDTALEPNFVELRNAVEQTSKEIGTRFDFKGSAANIELSEKGQAREIALTADSDFQIGQVKDILLAKLSKRGVDVRFLDDSAKIEKAGGDKVRQLVKVKNGIDADLGKKIQTAIKQSKLKVQAAIQGDIVRITGGKRDELQAAIAVLRKEISDVPLKFENMRD